MSLSILLVSECTLNFLLITKLQICNFRFVASARQLAKALEVPLVNDLGYTKRYVRCLQVLCLFLLVHLKVSGYKVDNHVYCTFKYYFGWNNSKYFSCVEYFIIAFMNFLIWNFMLSWFTPFNTVY